MGHSHHKTRRSLLKAGLGAVGLQLFSNLEAGVGTGTRSVVCIYLMGGNDSAGLLAPGGTADSPQFHPALAEIRDLYDSRGVAVLANIGDSGADTADRRTDPALSYLPDGYLTPGWAAGLSGAFTQFPAGRAGSGRANTSLVAPGATAGDLSRQVQAALASDGLGTEFPATPLGGQLRQVALVLAAGLTGGVYVCPMTAPPIFGDPAARETARLRELSGAMAAFHAATLSLGVGNRVTVFTASERHVTAAGGAMKQTPGAGGYELAMGSAVLGGVYGAGDGLDPAAARQRYLATVARWFGVPRPEMKHRFPRLDAAAPTLDFLV